MKSMFLGALAAFLSCSATTLSAGAATPTAASTRAAAAARSPIQFRASLDEEIFTLGQPIQLRFTANNTSKRAATLKFSSGQRFDFSVFRVGAQTPIYTWSASRMFLQSLGSLTLGAGQSRQFSATIGDEMGAIAPGKYRVEARLADTSGAIKAAPVFFQVRDLQLAMTARVLAPRYKIGAPIKIDMSVKNLARKANVVPFNSGMTYDVMIFDENKNLVWSYGANLRFIQVLGRMTWRANETKNFSATWNGVALPREIMPTKLQPGRYKIQAVLASTPRVFAPPIYVWLTN